MGQLVKDVWGFAAGMGGATAHFAPIKVRQWLLLMVPVVQPLCTRNVRYLDYILPVLLPFFNPFR